jgi:hypothetical protein
MHEPCRANTCYFDSREKKIKPKDEGPKAQIWQKSAQVFFITVYFLHGEYLRIY